MTSRSLRRALAALAVPAVALGVAAGAAPAQAAPSPGASTATTVTPRYAASLGAAWLARQITANGGYLAPFGAPDAGNTAYAVSALVGAGVGRDAVASATAWLKTQVADGLEDGSGDNAASLANLVLAATAAGEDPRAFGGSGTDHDLVARLLATVRTTGADAGLVGAQDPTFDGAFRQGLALAALDSAGVPASRLTAARGWLAGQQCAGGLWMSYRASTATPCPAADPATFSGPDTNSSALALQGLAVTGGIPFRAKALGALDAVQSNDGGFPFVAAAGQSSDPNSTAVVIQGILAARGAPESARFTVDGVTPAMALQSFQLGCSDPAADRGAYFYPGSRAANVLATIQAVPAQARTALPVSTRTLKRYLPTYPCAGTDTTVSTTTTDSSVAAASSPTARILGASAARAGTAGACAGTSGVTVAVDFTAFGGANQVRCAPGDPATGVAALQGAGFTPAGTARYGLAFVCRINNKPAPAQDPCQNTPPASAYWAYYHASQTATTWTYSSTGASTYNPAPGSIEAWAFGNGATPSLTPRQVRGR